jgi:DnaJ-class molecular chaperone
VKCKRCNGKGYLEFEHGLIQLICDKCKGTGEENDSNNGDKRDTGKATKQDSVQSKRKAKHKAR